MSKKRGRLRCEDEQKIVQNWTYLKDNFDPEIDVLDHMISDLVFDLHDNDSVKNGGEKTRMGRCERFLNILLNSGPEAYVVFLKALNKAGFVNIATKLEETVIHVSPEAVNQKWVDELPDDLKQQKPNDAVCSRLSTAFGNGWEHVMLELGIKQAKIDQEKMTNHGITATTITNLLIKWRQSRGNSAHFYFLLDAMRKADDRCNIEWDTVKKIAKRQ